MNQLVAVAPLSASSALVLGMGPTPLCMGKEPPSFWSWSSVRNHTMFGLPALAGGCGGGGGVGGGGVGGGVGSGVGGGWSAPHVDPGFFSALPGSVFR
jgi:hypothetical protein